MKVSPSPCDCNSRRMVGHIAAIILAGFTIPLVCYWLLYGRIPSVTPGEAKQRLRKHNGAVLLVDVRTPDRFSAGHIQGAVNWPHAAILETGSPGEVPTLLRNKTLLLVSDVGIASSQAASHLAKSEIAPAMNVRGGIQEWIRSAANEQPRRLPMAAGSLLRWLNDEAEPQGGTFDRWQMDGGRVVAFPFRRSPLFEQAAAVIAYFFFKPIYMALSALVAMAIWRNRSADIRALRWAMVFFLLGEVACAVNYFVYRETSYLWEYLHGFGMLVSFAYVTYALLEGIDRRVLMLSSPACRCALLALCGRCIKCGEPSCRLQRVFLMVIPALAVLALMLPTADWQDTSYNTLVFGSAYNYGHLRVQQQFENWYCAAAAIVMFTVSFAVLASAQQNRLAAVKVAFAAGMGPLMFGMLRMVLAGAYDENRVWYLFWEETTELLFVFGVCLILWVFRGSLLAQDGAIGAGESIHMPSERQEE